MCIFFIQRHSVDLLCSFFAKRRIRSQMLFKAFDYDEFQRKDKNATVIILQFFSSNRRIRNKEK